MSYLVLARRWRPQKFSDLVGQDVVVQTLRNALSSHHLAHAYLLTGIRGVGKTTIARLMAMSANCQQVGDDAEPCGHCESCTAIASGSHLDVRELDAASHTGVDDMRDMLDDVRYPPVHLAYKVYIIDEAHMLSKSAFNALLKTLEEPPAQVLFVLATTESDKLPVTVRSRCQRFDLRRLAVGEISSYLAHVLDSESIAYESEALLTIARASDGSVRDALSLTERVLAFSKAHIHAEDVRQSLGLLAPDIVRALSDAIADGHSAQAVATLRKAVMQGYGAAALLGALSEQWHQLACMMVDEGLLQDEPSEQTQAWLRTAAGLWSSEALDMRYQVLLHGLRDLALVDEQRGAEMVVMRLCHLRALLEADAPHADVQPLQQTAPIVQDLPKDTPKMPEKQHIAPKSTTSSHQANVPDATKDAPKAPEQQKIAPKQAGIYESWEAVLAAYSAIQAPITAILEQVECLSFSPDKLVLAVDAHQARFLQNKQREAFATWLGRTVVWQKKSAERSGETVATVRKQRQQQEQQQRWKHAEEDAAVKLLVQEMDCRLVDVQAGEHKTNGEEQTS